MKSGLPRTSTSLTGDGQFLLSLPEGALLRRLPASIRPPGKHTSPGLAVQGGGADLEEQVQAVRPLHQGTEGRHSCAGRPEALAHGLRTGDADVPSLS